MTNDLTLVADVGGTNTRFALADANGIIAESFIRYSNADVDCFVEAAQEYFAALVGPKPSSICIAIAGPVSAGKGELTNGDWEFDTEVLAQSLGLERAHLLNDLVALGYALDVLPDHVVKQISGGKPHGDQALVAGIATGFNVSMCHAGHVIEAELGHASLPSSVMEVLRVAVGDKASSFHKVEALFSGDGLAALHVALGFKETNPAQITALHTRNKHSISQIDGNNDDSQFEDIKENGLTFKCEDCEYTTGEMQDLVKHAEIIHHQCAKCGDDLPSRADLKRHRKEKHCDNCGKVVNSDYQLQSVVV